MTHVNNVPDFRVIVAGTDITPKLKGTVRQPGGKPPRPRLVSLSLTEKRGGEADQLDIVIDDSDGGMALPPAGATVTVALGWLRGSDVTPGLIDKGSFIVEDVEHSGAPDVITLRARSADFTSQIRTRRERSWRGTTIGAVVKDVAARNRLTPRCAPALASLPVEIVAQSRESDIAFLRRLGREHDAVATIKGGALIFAPVGARTSPGGKPLPAITIRRRDGDRHVFRIEKRDEASAVEASWHDRGEAKKKTVKVGDGDKKRRLARTYASEAEAKRAAKAEHGRLARDPLKLSFDLALGRPELYPEQRVTAAGFKKEIDAGKWLIVEARHTLDQGLRTSLQMETLG